MTYSRSLSSYCVLSVSICSNLTKVPDSLDLSNTHIKRLPESTCSLYNLQILKLNNCTLFKELPSNLHKLTNLRRLEFMDTEVTNVPEHLGKMKYLQVLMSSLMLAEVKNSAFNN